MHPDFILAKVLEFVFALSLIFREELLLIFAKVDVYSSKLVVSFISSSLKILMYSPLTYPIDELYDILYQPISYFC